MRGQERPWTQRSRESTPALRFWRQHVTAVALDQRVGAYAHRLANAQAKLAGVRMKYQTGFEAAKRAVIDALKIELAADPALAEQLAGVVAGLAPEER